MSLPAATHVAALACCLGTFACAAQPGPEGGPTADTTRGITVVCSDYVSTAVALVDPRAEMLTWSNLIHSGSRVPSVHTALSGDVGLPTQAPISGAVLLIDRYPNAVLTWVDPVSGEVLQQLNVGMGFSANPRDVLVFEDGAMAVTRYNANPMPQGAGDFDLGDDVLLLDADGTPVDALATAEAELNGRPDRLLAVGDEIWVSLNRASNDFSTYAEGMILRLRRDDAGALERVGEIRLIGLKNCAGLKHTPLGVVVSCTGSYTLAGDIYVRSESALVGLDDAGEERWRLSATDGRVGQCFGPELTHDQDGGVVALLYGEDASLPDAVIRYEPETDTVSKLYTAAAPWTLSALTTADDGVVVVGDGDPEDPRICRLTTPISCLAACQATGLPPRVLGGYGPKPR